MNLNSSQILENSLLEHAMHELIEFGHAVALDRITDALHEALDILGFLNLMIDESTSKLVLGFIRSFIRIDSATGFPTVNLVVNPHKNEPNWHVIHPITHCLWKTRKEAKYGEDNNRDFGVLISTILIAGSSS